MKLLGSFDIKRPKASSAAGIIALLACGVIAATEECAPLSPEAVSWWSGEVDGGDSIASNHGVLKPGVSLAPGKVGTAFSLDGTGFVEVPDSPSLRLSSASQFSLEAWVFPTSFAGQDWVPLGAIKPYYYGLLYNTRDRFLRGHTEDGNRWIYADAGFDLPLNQWTHVAQTWDGSAVKVYANGKLLGSGAIAGSRDGRIEGPLDVGKWELTVPTAQLFTFTGLVDEILVYRSALGTEDISASYAAGSAGKCPGLQVALVQLGLRCASLVVRTNQPIRGGEVGFAFDPEMVSPVRVTPGDDLPGGARIQSNLNLLNPCAGESPLTRGIVLGWINPAEEPTPAGTHELLRICFSTPEGVEVGSCSELAFVSCLGPPEAPVRNVVAGVDGRSIPLEGANGSVCINEESSFTRGDANLDGNRDITDPIVVLQCLFLGALCSSCLDAMDADDDGVLNITDPIYLLEWRFLDGPPPKAPFPDCGKDPTPDALEDCMPADACAGAN
jgi:hypothetical protein